MNTPLPGGGGGGPQNISEKPEVKGNAMVTWCYHHHASFRWILPYGALYPEFNFSLDRPKNLFPHYFSTMASPHEHDMCERSIWGVIPSVPSLCRSRGQRTSSDAFDDTNRPSAQLSHHRDRQDRWCDADGAENSSCTDETCPGDAEWTWWVTSACSTRLSGWACTQHQHSPVQMNRTLQRLDRIKHTHTHTRRVCLRSNNNIKITKSTIYFRILAVVKLYNTKGWISTWTLPCAQN